MDPQLPRPSDVISPHSSPNPDVPAASLQPPDLTNPLPPPVEPNQPLQARDVPIQAPKRFPKKLLGVFFIILLVGSMAAYYFLVYKPKNHDDHRDHNAMTNVQPDPVIEEVHTKTCLASADYDGIYLAVNGVARPETRTFGEENFEGRIVFNPNTTDLSAPQSTGEAIAKAFADFAKTKHDSRQFKLMLSGQYGGNLQADIDLANKRAEKVKTMLLDDGAAEDLTVVMEAVSAGSADQFAQTVKISIDPTCSN